MTEIKDEKRNQLMLHYIQNLINDPNINRNELRTCLETMIQINRRVLNNNDIKFRRIRTSNAVFHQKVWKHSNARSFLLISGWTSGYDNEDKECPQIIRMVNEEYVKNCLSVLIDYRDVKPETEDWIESNKYVVENELKLKEEEMRRKAAIEREEQLKKFEIEKSQNRVLAQNIKKEIKSNINHRKLFFKDKDHQKTQN